MRLYLTCNDIINETKIDKDLSMQAYFVIFIIFLNCKILVVVVTCHICHRSLLTPTICPIEHTYSNHQMLLELK